MKKMRTKIARWINAAMLLFLIVSMTMSILSVRAESELDESFLSYVRQVSLQRPPPYPPVHPYHRDVNISNLFELQDVAVVFLGSARSSLNPPQPGVPGSLEQDVFQKFSDLETAVADTQDESVASMIRFLSGVCLDGVATGKSAPCQLARLADVEQLPVVLTFHRGVLQRSLSSPWLQVSDDSKYQHSLSFAALQQWLLLLATPRAVQLNHISEASTLPRVVKDDPRGLAMVLVLVPHTGGEGAFAFGQRVAYEVSEALQGIARVFITTVFPQDEKDWGMTAPQDAAAVDARCTVLVVRRDTMAAKASKDDLRGGAATPLHQTVSQIRRDVEAAAKDHVASASAEESSSQTSLEETLVASSSLTCASVERCMEHVLENALPRVIFSSPQRRMRLAHSILDRNSTQCPSMLLIMFFPNLLASLPHAYGESFEMSNPIGTALMRSNPQIKYYASRLAKAMAAGTGELRNLLPDAKCRNGAVPQRVMLADPMHEKDLFHSVAFLSSDMYQSSKTVKANAGKSFSGKSRDNLIVLFVNGSWQAAYPEDYFQVKGVRSFVERHMVRTTAQKAADKVSERPLPVIQRTQFPDLEIGSTGFAGNGHVPSVSFTNLESFSLNDHLRDTAFLVYNSSLSVTNASVPLSMTWKTKIMHAAVDELARGEQGDSLVRFFCIDLATNQYPNWALPGMHKMEQLGFLWVRRERKPTYHAHRSENCAYTQRHAIVSAWYVVKGAHMASKVTFQEDWRSIADIFTFKWQATTTPSDVHSALVRFAKRYTSVPLRLGAGLEASKISEDTLIGSDAAEDEDL